MTSAIARDLVDIEGYLARHEQKELVRFALVGSVDDGKSTLIGRLLHDTHGVYEDQLAAVKKASSAKGTAEGEDEIDFSLFTDGLKAEREQGITIDVAYRYFSTEVRKFIIADTPGHEQYTRNMATGASTADIAVILLDARLGILPQSRRHAAIASLLGIGQLLVAVNKMDLVAYDEKIFRELEAAFRPFLSRLSFDGATFVPVSAKKGDNVVHRSEHSPWYTGPTMLGLLDTLPVRRTAAGEGQPLRFPVQTVIRPHLDYRGFAGWIARGVARTGDEVMILPSGRKTRILAVDTFEGPLTHASAPVSATLRLADEVDVSRGEMITAPDRPATASTDVEATLVWLSERAFDPSRKLVCKHTSRWVPARIADVRGRLSLETLDLEPTSGISLNDIVSTRVHLARPIFCDAYTACRATGAFVLVDALDNATVAAGMITDARSSAARRGEGRPTEVERSDRFGHRAGLFLLAGDLHGVERALFDRGVAALALDARSATPAVVGALLDAGLVVLVSDIDEASFAALSAVAGERPHQDFRSSSGDVGAHVALAIALAETVAGGSGI
ncbi:MAG: sulfate adenylyltransferase [Polyangiaceae bacterium]|nr:sulfate adenylyltransferase [Polyangiaceae bacterium]